MVSEPLPKKSDTSQAIETAVAAVLGAVPWVGGPAATVVQGAMTWRLDKRRDAWFEALNSQVQALADGRAWEHLTEDPLFVDALVQATLIAQKTSDEVKLDALRCGVLNSLDADAAQADERARFLRFVDEFTASHLRMLTILDNPQAALDASGGPGGSGNLSGLLHTVEPSFDDEDFANLVHGDLNTAGLINSGGLKTMMTPAGVMQQRSTRLGRRFLAFVRPPAP